MVVLKRLRDAETDGDRIRGVVRGTAVNQNGAAAGPTVPNGPAQERVIEAVLSRAGVSPRETWTIWKPTAPGPSWATPSRCGRPPRCTARDGTRIGHS